jgi:hypothetical protein
VIAAKEISRVVFRLEGHQSGVVTAVGFAHTMAFPLIQRIDVDLSGVERSHGSKKVRDPFQVGFVFISTIPETQDLEVIRVAARGKRGCVGDYPGSAQRLQQKVSRAWP